MWLLPKGTANAQLARFQSPAITTRTPPNYGKYLAMIRMRKEQFTAGERSL